MRYLSLSALILSISLVTPAQTLNPKSTQESATSDTNSSADKAQAPSDAKPDYSNEADVIEKYQARLRFENDGSGRREETARIRVQSEAGVRRWGQLRFGYNSANENLEIPYVRVTKKDGNVVTAGAEAVQELTEPVQQIAPVYTDFHEKHVTVPGLRIGDVLEWQTVVVVHTPFAQGQFWALRNFTKNEIVLDEQLEIDVPASRAIKLKAKPGYEAKITEENGRRIYRWSTSNLETEAAKSAAEKDAGRKKKKKQRPDEPADVQLTSFPSWEEVGRWYAGLEKDRRNPSPAVKAKAAELTKGLQTDMDKIEALYDYTALNFRYVSLALGMGRYQPQAADDILRNQYGDCKDKNTLLAALLEAEGFHASTVLISSVHKLDPEIPSPSQFNHAITMVPLGKEEIWMDTTTEVAPFRLLVFPLRKKQALVIPQDGTPHLEETPADPPIPDTEFLQITGKVDDSGKLDAKISGEVRGDSEVTMRLTMRGVASSQWQKVMEGVNTKLGFGGDVSEVMVSDPAATRQPFTYSYHVAKANYLDLSKKKLELKLPASIVALATADADDADSPDPIKLGAANTYEYKVKLEFPAKYTVRPPLPISVKRDYASYEVSYALEGTVLSAERTLKINQSELSSSRVPDYLAFRRSVLEETAQKISLETDIVSASASPSDTKPAELFKRGNDARKTGNYALAIDLLKRGVDADPKTKSGWNDLGLAYFDSRQDDLAINSFQKQIGVNPYHEYAFNNLGRVYLRQRAYDEAIKWFNKQLEVNPLDKYAHGSLGIAYLEQRKYADAVPELDKAASLNPDNAEEQVRLGEAYLNLEQDDKAMAAFDRALKISARPVVWNNIAYQLALKKAHLDVARSYAESAVSSTMASLRVLSLDAIDNRDLGATSMLANSWDTLGWVAFAEGKLDEAVKYLTAAWQLSPKVEPADHLAQAYEKLGDKEKAAHFYALAMNAKRPEPETRGRLAALVGGDSKADAMIAASGEEFATQGTVHLANSSKLEGKADFFVLLKTGPNSGVAVDGAKFVSGEERLKPLGDALRSAHFQQSLPDGTAVKLLRRGTLSCAPTADCIFRLIPPEEVRSVN
jgi:tetratricopeptide (TPR) repeat protein